MGRSMSSQPRMKTSRSMLNGTAIMCRRVIAPIRLKRRRPPSISMSEKRRRFPVATSLVSSSLREGLKPDRSGASPCAIIAPLWQSRAPKPRDSSKTSPPNVSKTPAPKSPSCRVDRDKADRVKLNRANKPNKPNRANRANNNNRTQGKFALLKIKIAHGCKFPKLAAMSDFFSLIFPANISSIGPISLIWPISLISPISLIIPKNPPLNAPHRILCAAKRGAYDSSSPLGSSQQYAKPSHCPTCFLRVCGCIQQQSGHIS